MYSNESVISTYSFGNLPKIYLCDGGCCCAQKGLIDGNIKCGKENIHSIFVYIEYKNKKILFDTGYDSKYFENKGFNSLFFHAVLPVDEYSIKNFNDLFKDEDIDLVIISHYHPDHICGLRKFIKAKFLAWGRPKSGIFSGFIPSLLPNDFYSRVTFVSEIKNYSNNLNLHKKLLLPCFNIFENDENLTMILLDGHSSVHSGLLIANKIFLIADSTWTRSSYREKKYPLFITNLSQENTRKYYETLEKIRVISLENGFDILPSHCPEITSLFKSRKFMEYNYEKLNNNDDKKIKLVLITGASGFVGRNVSEYLIKKGIKVLGIGRKNIPDNLKTLQNSEKLNDLFSYEILDLENKSLLLNIFEKYKPSHVIHCAGLCKSWGTEDEFYKSNVLITKNLLEISISYKISRFIHISSSSIYVDNYWSGKTDILESDSYSTKNKTNYNKSKLEAEYEVQKILSHHQMETIIIRPRGIYGRDDPLLLPKLIKSSHYLPDFGDVYASLTHVDNLSHALYLSLKMGSGGKIYNICDPKPYNLKKIINHIKLNSDKTKISYLSKIKCNDHYLKLIIFLIVTLLELIYSILLKFGIKNEPPVTRYTLSLLMYNTTLNISNAQENLGYCAIEENGIIKTIELLNIKNNMINLNQDVKTKLLTDDFN